MCSWEPPTGRWMRREGNGERGWQDRPLGVRAVGWGPRPDLDLRFDALPRARSGEGGGGRGRVRRLAKLLAVAMSAVVLVACGLGWWQLGGQGTANVIAPTAAAAAAAVGGEQNILVVGLDSRADAQGNPLPQQVLDQLHAGSSSDGGDNTDTMIIIHIPTGGGKATGFSIPRDSYVQLAEGYGAHKINSAYTYGQNAARTTLTTQGVSGPTLAVQSAAGGARTAIATVSALTGLAITHYAAVNLAGFYAISQAVGGVSVCLNTSVGDSYSGAHFPAGPQTVQGSEALAFVRQRHGLPGGDLRWGSGRRSAVPEGITVDASLLITRHQNRVLLFGPG